MQRIQAKSMFFFLALMGAAVFTFAEGNKENGGAVVPRGDDMKLVPDEGLLVVGVAEDGPADKAGIVRGDVILTVEGKKIAEISDLYQILEDKLAGEILELTIRHGSETKEIALKIEERLFREPLGLALQGNGFRGMPGRGNFMDRIGDLNSDFLLRFRRKLPFEDRDFDFQFEGPIFESDFFENLPHGFDAEDIAFSAMVMEVLEESPAAVAGVASGDIIIAVNGKDLENDYSLRDAVTAFEPGETLKLTLIRDGELTELSCLLTDNEDGRTYLGIRFRELFHFNNHRDSSFLQLEERGRHWNWNGANKTPEAVRPGGI